MPDPAALLILTAESGLTRYLKEIRRYCMLEPQDEYMLARIASAFAAVLARRARTNERAACSDFARSRSRFSGLRKSIPTGAYSKLNQGIGPLKPI